jgi:hypothetical protein
MGKKAMKSATGKGCSTAEEVAKAMAENMAANQQDSNWELEHEKMQYELAQKALRKNELHPDQKKKEKKPAI